MPADRSRELEAELTPVLALLDGVDAECARIVAQARHDAEQIIAAARDEAAAVPADADQRARSARDEAAREILAAARAEAAATMARCGPAGLAGTRAGPASAFRRWRAGRSAWSANWDRQAGTCLAGRPGGPGTPAAPP